MIKITETWHTVHFENESKGVTVNLELNVNHSTKSYSIYSYNQEMVSFAGDTIQETKLKVQLLQSVVKWLESNL